MIRYLFEENPDFAQVFSVIWIPAMFIISVVNYMINRKDATEMGDFVNFGVMVMAILLFIPWVICVILHLL